MQLFHGLSSVADIHILCIISLDAARLGPATNLSYMCISVQLNCKATGSNLVARTRDPLWDSNTIGSDTLGKCARFNLNLLTIAVLQRVENDNDSQKNYVLSSFKNSRTGILKH